MEGFGQSGLCSRGTAFNRPSFASPQALVAGAVDAPLKSALCTKHSQMRQLVYVHGYPVRSWWSYIAVDPEET